MNKAIKQYYAACEDIREAFVQKYYNTYPEWTGEIRWVADDVGGALEISGDFWSVNDMVTALKLGVKEDDLFEWYHSSIDAGLRNEPCYNLENYLKRFKYE